MQLQRRNMLCDGTAKRAYRTMMACVVLQSNRPLAMKSAAQQEGSAAATMSGYSGRIPEPENVR